MEYSSNVNPLVTEVVGRKPSRVSESESSNANEKVVDPEVQHLKEMAHDEEEVEAALNRVAELEAQKTSSPDEPEKVKNAEAVAQSLKDAVAAEDASASSPAHEEL